MSKIYFGDKLYGAYGVIVAREPVEFSDPERNRIGTQNGLK